MTHFGGHSDTGSSTDTSGDSGQTVGFRYFMGIHMGICRGPIDEMVEIRVGDRTAWSGSVGTNITFDIDAYDLFGGEGGEGGIKGQLTTMFGAATQTCPDTLANMLENVLQDSTTNTTDLIFINNESIEGVHSDDYVGILFDGNGFAWKTFSSKPKEPLLRPWYLTAPIRDLGSAHGAKVNPAYQYDIRFHLETGGTIPFTETLGMQFDRYYNLGNGDREVRLVAPGTATFIVDIRAVSGATLTTAALTLHLT